MQKRFNQTSAQIVAACIAVSASGCVTRPKAVPSESVKVADSAEPTAMNEEQTSPNPADPKESKWGEFVCEGLDRPALNDDRVLQAMSRVPRHRFLPQGVQGSAYQDRALSIGQGQTVSQPYIVALMTQEAHVSEGAKVLEVGTGSGYQAAVLSEMGADVYSVELLPDLAAQADVTLKQLGFQNVKVRSGDGYAGWAEAGPFDAILVAAAAPRIPPALVQQLANRGRLVIPLEEAKTGAERLVVIERDGTTLRTRELGAVKFVPMKGEVRGKSEVEKKIDESEELKGLEKLIGAEAASSTEVVPASSVDIQKRES